MQPLRGDNDKYSWKKITGGIVIFICIYMALTDQLTANKANEIIFGTLFAGGIALLGVETVMKRRNNG